jgi:hypothetical protein
MYGLETAIRPWFWPPEIYNATNPRSNLTEDRVSCSDFATTTGKTWLTQLAQAKRNGTLPKLRKLSLIERISTTNGTTRGFGPEEEYSRMPTYPPDKSLERARLEFYVTIRELPLKSSRWPDLPHGWSHRVQHVNYI